MVWSLMESVRGEKKDDHQNPNKLQAQPKNDANKEEKFQCYSAVSFCFFFNFVCADCWRKNSKIKRSFILSLDSCQFCSYGMFFGTLFHIFLLLLCLCMCSRFIPPLILAYRNKFDCWIVFSFGFSNDKDDVRVAENVR